MKSGIGHIYSKPYGPVIDHALDLRPKGQLVYLMTARARTDIPMQVDPGQRELPLNPGLDEMLGFEGTPDRWPLQNATAVRPYMWPFGARAGHEP